MYTLIKVWDANHINGVALDDLTYPLQKFDWAYPIIGDDIQRPFSAGRWDTRKSVGSMEITCEGTIVAASTSDYWVKRKALVACVLPEMTQSPAIWKHSSLEITPDDGYTYLADVQLSSYAIPVAALGSPTISPFMFSWTCNLGYWTDASGSAVRL
jgi:hypothetical protein